MLFRSRAFDGFVRAGGGVLAIHSATASFKGSPAYFEVLGGRFVGQGKWSDVYVYRDGCVPDGKCENIADGKVWIDTTDEQDKQLKRISGKYEINLNGKHLEGTFLAKRHDRRRPLRLCM